MAGSLRPTASLAEPGVTLTPFGDSPMAALARLIRPQDNSDQSPVNQDLGELGRAARDFLAHRSRADDASAEAAALQARADRLYPPIPDLIRRADDPTMWEPRCELEHRDSVTQRWSSSPAATPRTDAFDAFHAARQTINKQLGISALDAAWDRAKDEEYAAAARVAALKPTTYLEAAIKYAVLLASFASQEQQEVLSARPFFEFLDDLERLVR